MLLIKETIGVKYRAYWSKVLVLWKAVISFSGYNYITYKQGTTENEL